MWIFERIFENGFLGREGIRVCLSHNGLNFIGDIKGKGDQMSLDGW
jgi:hypothetical protein